MRKLLFIATLILFSNFTLAQSVNDLDLKNGFRHFKLGSSPNLIKNIVKKTNQFSPKIVRYDYLGKDIDNISNVKVTSVTLDFYKNKLCSIGINFGSFEEKSFEIYEFNDILSALEKTYGINWVNPTNKSGVITNGAIWAGKKVTLELLRTDFSKSKIKPADYGFIGGYINIYDKKLMNEMESSDF